MNFDKLTTNGIEVHLPGSDGYKERQNSAWNHHARKRTPTAFFLPSNAEQVSACVKFLAENKTAFSVRSGGHNFWSVRDDVVCIETARIRTITKGDGDTFTFGMGLNLGEVDAATKPLAIPMGVVSSTGLGLTLTGGVGFLSRLHGFSGDNVLSAVVVTANGDIKTVSPTENEDLFFGIRGAAPSLAVVVELTLQAYPHESGHAQFAALPSSAENFAKFVNWQTTVADVANDPRATTYFAVQNSPDFSTRLVCAFNTHYDLKEEETFLHTDIEGQIVIMPPAVYPHADVIQTAFNGSFTEGYWYFFGGAISGDLTPEIQKACVDAWDLVPCEKGIKGALVIEQRGGNHSRASPESSASPFRDQKWEIYLLLGTDEESRADEIAKIARRIREMLQAADAGSLEKGRAAGASGPLFKPSDGSCFYGSNFERLKQIKAKHDPNGVFQFGFL